MKSSSLSVGDKIMLSLICVVGWPKAGGPDQRAVPDGQAHENAQTILSQVTHVRRVFASFDGMSVSEDQQRVLRVSRLFKKPASSPLLKGLSEHYLQPVS
jgi:hypothetical protein